MLATKALDGPTEENKKGRWTFALWLFGQDPNRLNPTRRSLLGRDPSLVDPGPRHGVPLHRPDHRDGASILRFAGRGRPAFLRARSVLIDEAEDETLFNGRLRRRASSWGVAGLMVKGIARERRRRRVHGYIEAKPRRLRREPDVHVKIVLRFVCAQELRTSLKTALSLKPGLSARSQPQHTTPGREHHDGSTSSAQRDC